MVIDQKTVFVLGAGSSKPLGFPLARELKEKVQRNLTNPRRLSELAEAISPGSRPGLFEGAATRLAQGLQRSDSPSVDAFLETHEQGERYLNLSKAAIAQALLPFEVQDDLIGTSDWYGDFFGRLLAESGLDGFESNEIAFVTFNYDRSLEQYLYETLLHASGSLGTTIASKIREIPIMHMYGNLGPLPWQSTTGAVRYGVGRPAPKVIAQAASSLQLIGDRTRPGQFDQARELIQEAAFVFFLGFGYDRQNLDRLKPERLFSTVFRGTAYAEPPGRQLDIQRTFQDTFDSHPVHFLAGSTAMPADQVSRTDCKTFVGQLALSALVR